MVNKAIQNKLGSYLTPRTTSLLSDLSSTNKSPSRIVGQAQGHLSNILEEEGDNNPNSAEAKAKLAQQERLSHKNF